MSVLMWINTTNTDAKINFKLKKIKMKAITGTGVKLKCGCSKIGTRVMKSNNSTITPTLRQIDNIEYKGNSALLAQRWIH